MKVKCTCMLCEWSKVGRDVRMDGIKCPECGGPVFTNPIKKDEANV